MSWARYWATRARDALQARPAAPFAARSWLTRLNSVPAAPPTPATGRAVGLGFGCTGGWAATAAGWAAGAAAATAGVGAGVGAGVSASRRARSLGPAWRAFTNAKLMGATTVATAGWIDRDPIRLTEAIATSGALTSNTIL